MKKVLVEGMPLQQESIQAQFQAFRKKHGDSKPLISLFDQTVMGHVPVLFGAEGIKANANIGISLAPLTLESDDTFPFRSGLAPHQGPDAKKLHRKAYKSYYEEKYYKALNDAYWAKLREMGAKRDRYPGIMESINEAPDHLLALGIPKFEFPRSDIKQDVRHFGALKKTGFKNEKKGLELPEWWGDIAAAKREGKKIVAVSQGTVEGRLEDLVLPTIEALKDRNDILLIATTVLVEPKDVKNLVVPANTRVEKFVPYDELLPLVS